ncbi:MAG: alpha/beta hydrolase, partial [Thermoleophilia bacterium]|nr:alpha/beta hydrolase [Thermoleophilia bacterium]
CSTSFATSPRADTDPMSEVRLLHGLGADRRAFQRFERLLPADWSIESLDLLGHGDAPHPDRGYSLEQHAAYVAELVEDAAPVFLVGHSYGAATSVALAATRPELVRGLVLLDPVVGLSVDREGSKTGEMIEAKRSGRLTEQVASLYPDASPALRAWTVDTWERMAIGVVEELDPDWTRFADVVTCPVSIIHGEPELGGSGDLAADWFDEPRVTQIDGAGHYLHATHARETAAAVIDSLHGMLSGAA